MYWCHTLGELSLFRDRDDAGPLMRAGKPLAIIAYLSLAPARRANRAPIAALLWPDAEHPRQALRQALYRLRDLGGDDELVWAEGTDLVLSQDVTLDWQVAEQALARGDCEHAYQLLGGTFLGDFAEPSTVEFDHWVESMRTRFRDARGQAGELLVAVAVAAGCLERALGITEELVALNPLAERWVRLQCLVLERLARPDEALRRYHAFEALLAAALSDRPSDEMADYARHLERPVELPTIYPEHPSTLPGTSATTWRRPATRTIAAATVGALAVGGLIASSVYRTRLANAPFAHGVLYVEGRTPLPNGRSVDSLYAIDWRCGARGECIRVPQAAWPRTLPPKLITTLHSEDGVPVMRASKVVGDDTIPITPGSTNEGWPIWAPDRRRVAIARGHRVGADYASRILIVNEGGQTREVTSEAGVRDEPLAWSPDGRIAFARLQDQRWTLWTTDSAGVQENLTGRFQLPDERPETAAFTSDGRALVVSSGSHLWVLDFAGGRAEHVPVEHPVASLAVSPDDRWLGAILSQGAERQLVIISRNTGDARVLAEFQEGKWLIRGWVAAPEASEGLRAEDPRQLGSARAPDTLWYEPWMSLDSTRWLPFGDPLPTLAPRAGPEGRGALLSNGDHLWPSGVVSREEIDLRDGITLDVLAHFRFTGAHWQEFEVALVPLAGAIVEGERGLEARVAFWWLAGPSPEYQEPMYACGTAGDAQLTSSGWTLEAAHRIWHTVGITIRPDWLAECRLDGELLGSFQVPASLRVPRAAIMLAGRSFETTIYHGPVVVTRP
jgi:DNA-binding SARP family transcriptional activator